MMRNAVWMAVLAVALACAALPARADYEAGQREWGAGRPDEALAEWRAAADAGDRRAMLALGRLFVQGLGVVQDYVQAHVWLNLAASRGEAAAVPERDTLAAKMTPQQIAVAQERAAAWRPGASGAAGAPAPAGAPGIAAAVAPAVTAAPDADRHSDAGPPPPRAIREAQALLGALGYTPGPADGVWGRRSVQAYQAFLRDAGLPPAEVLTQEALRALRAIAKRRSVGATAARDASRGSPETSAPRRAAALPDALHRAAQAGDIDGLKAALGAGANVNTRDGRGWTALMHAVNKGYTLLVPPLLAAKADPDMRAADGATALFMAAVHGHSEIIALLMEAGADLSVRGPKGKTAVDVARTRGDPAVLGVLGIREVGEVFRDCEGCPELVVVASGSYMMGAPLEEEDRRHAEGPVHRVTIAEPIAVGVYEVTFGEYSRFVAATGHSAGDSCWILENLEWGEWTERSGHNWRNPGFRQDEREPVVCVNWEDAQVYVRWLSRKTGKKYRLLSESEWEYVARAGTTGPFHTGSTISTEQANYNGNFTYGSGRKGRFRRQTVAVGSFSANAFGLHDVHGNVEEWVEDCWHGSYAGAPSDGSAWTEGKVCGYKVSRGGSWFTSPEFVRSAFRSRELEVIPNDYLGFRVARTLD